MDERGKQLQAQLQFMERNGRALEELVSKMLHMREEQEAFLSLFARGLHDVAAQEDSKALAPSLASVGTSCAKLVSETHDVMMLRAEPEVLQVLAQIQDWGIVPMKRLLDDRDKAIKIEQKLQKEFEEKSRNGSAREKEKKSRMLSDQRRRVENVNGLIDLHMRKFEQYRTAKMKKILNEIVRSNVFYHAKALEVLTAPCASVHRIATVGDMAEDLP